MKKLVLLLVLPFSILRGVAQDTLLQRILDASSKVTSIKSDLKQINEKGGNVVEKSGVLHYSFPDKFSARFENGTFIIVNGDYINVDLGSFHDHFKMRNGPVRSLTQVFLYAFQGRCVELAEINNYDINIKTGVRYHIVTMTTRKKYRIGMGLSQVVFKVDRDDYLVKEISIIDFKGTKNTYTLQLPQYDVPINGDVFNL